MKYSKISNLFIIVFAFFAFSCENVLAPEQTLNEDNSQDLVDDCSLKVGDYIWYDSNHDGLQNELEKGIGGVTLYLLNTDSVAIDTAISDSSGFYQFHGLCAGEYYIQYDSKSLAEEYEPTISLSGDNNEKDSNENPTNIFIETELTIIRHIDFGFVTEQGENGEDGGDDEGENGNDDDNGDGEDNGNKDDDEESGGTSKEEAYEYMEAAYILLVEIYALIELVPESTDLSEVWIPLAYAIDRLRSAYEAYENGSYNDAKGLAKEAKEFALETLDLLQGLLDDIEDNEDGEDGTDAEWFEGSVLED